MFGRTDCSSVNAGVPSSSLDVARGKLWWAIRDFWGFSRGSPVSHFHPHILQSMWIHIHFISSFTSLMTKKNWRTNGGNFNPVVLKERLGMRTMCSGGKASQLQESWGVGFETARSALIHYHVLLSSTTGIHLKMVFIKWNYKWKLCESIFNLFLRIRYD